MLVSLSKDSLSIRMAMHSNHITSVLNDELLSLRLCTFNCRSMKNRILDIRNLCDKYNVIFLQEYWLLPFELSKLSGVDRNFYRATLC